MIIQLDSVICKETYAGCSLGGYYLEPPSPAEVEHFMRSLAYDERLTLIAGGFHRGPSIEHCYRYKEFVEIVAKREYNNPAGGVRKLDREELVAWLRDTVGDRELAFAVDLAFERTDSMAEAVDIVRIVSFVRLAQYYEVVEDTKRDAVCNGQEVHEQC